MRAIKITYRAIFAQPLGVLNPMGMKIPGTFPVELFRRGQDGAQWQLREIESRNRVVYNKLGRFASSDHAKTVIAGAFEKQVEDWQIWGRPPITDPTKIDLPVTERLLSPDEIVSLGDDKFAWLDDEDRTHILHGPLIDPKAKVPNAACGAKVNAKCFISTKANVEPTCKACAEVWKKEYRGK